MGVEDVFKEGPLQVQILTIPQRKNSGETSLPPKPLLLVFPSPQGGEEEEYPPLLFLHGYMLLNSFYTQLLQHVASHGYITIAPQMYTVAGLSATKEIENAVDITEWLPAGLSQHLPPQVRPDFQKLVIAGHSRGGKVAFGAALGPPTTPPPPSLPYAALIGVDPVDGVAGCQIPPPILTHKDHSFHLNIPVLVIGSGLGPDKENWLVPACAPAGLNHQNFFRECCAPAYHFVAIDYGHMDFLNDETSGVAGKVTYCACKKGTTRKPMRSFSAGVIVAFLNAWLRNATDDLEALLADPSLAPVTVEQPECYLLEKAAMV